MTPAGDAGASIRRAIHDMVAQATAGNPHAGLVRKVVAAVDDALAMEMAALCLIGGTLAERVPIQKLALRLVRESIAMTEESFDVAMTKLLEARS